MTTCTYDVNPNTKIPSASNVQVNRLVNSPDAVSPSPLRERHIDAAMSVVAALFPPPKKGAESADATAKRMVAVSAVRSLFEMCSQTAGKAAAWTLVLATRFMSGIRAQVLEMAEASGCMRCLTDDSALHHALSVPWALALRMLRHPKQDEVLSVLSQLPPEDVFGHPSEVPGVADTSGEKARRDREKRRPTGVLSARQLSCLQVPFWLLDSNKLKELVMAAARSAFVAGGKKASWLGG